MTRALFLVATCFSVAPAAEPLSPFGIGSCHVNGRSVEDFERWVPQTREIGIQVHRSLMSHWGAVEPEPGKWDWANVDAQWRYLDERGISTGTLLIGTPSWNKKDPPGHLPVNHVEGWSEYVKQLTGHFKGRIRRYEVWNEPPNFTGPDQTPADYATLVSAAYTAAKASDPACEIGLTAKSAHLHYLGQVIRAGAKGHYDWISLHPYEVLDGIVTESGLDPVYLNLVPSVRRMLAAVDPAKKDVPIQFTELGVDAKHHGAEAQASALVKAYVMGIAQGVENIQWFEGRDGDSGPMGLLDGDGKPRPAWHAYARMIAAMGQHPEPLGWVVPAEGVYGFVFKNGKTPLMVAWAPAKGRGTVKFPGPVDFENLVSGNKGKVSEWEIDGTPVCFRGIPEGLVKSATPVSQALPPWPGDPGRYGDATAVEIDPSKNPAERGLHTRGGDAVSHAIVAYGGSARAGDAPGGALYVVDPAFLSYDQVPLRITAEVRRKDPAVNAGFKLVYESPEGFKTAGGWKTVPEEDQWHTMTWDIPDPCFVNYWGYNFRLESDGNEFNKYYVRRIKVEKTSGTDVE
ncbi:hypothetical protein [Luteolibacter marinus]|uniref:hypothetical protein n=1 Tax=Luteolibacter marinus TaxID=2776705 RepID=UPI001867425E|nr:hypothetical protein [Luteolibacter marinus]